MAYGTRFPGKNSGNGAAYPPRKTQQQEENAMNKQSNAPAMAAGMALGAAAGAMAMWAAGQNSRQYI